MQIEVTKKEATEIFYSRCMEGRWKWALWFIPGLIGFIVGLYLDMHEVNTFITVGITISSFIPGGVAWAKTCSSAQRAADSHADHLEAMQKLAAEELEEIEGAK
jgi:hypothetical protein